MSVILQAHDDKLEPCSHPANAEAIMYAASDYITCDGFQIVRCKNCGLARTVPRPSDISKYYPAGYYGEGGRYPSLIQYCLGRLYARRASQIEMLAGNGPGVALDIGCGQGQLLAALRARGWTVTGTEMSASGASYARDVLGIDVRVGDIGDIQLQENVYDLIVMWHVLEHVDEPAAYLSQIASLLKPGGLFFVALPNFGSPEARWGKDKWFHLDVPRHLNHFDLPALQRALSFTDMQIERVRYFSAEYDLFSAIQTVLNRMGIRHNLLYNLLRARGARLLAGSTGRASVKDTASTTLFAPILAILGVVWVPLAAMAGRGSTMSLYVRKPSGSTSQDTDTR